MAAYKWCRGRGETAPHNLALPDSVGANGRCKACARDSAKRYNHSPKGQARTRRHARTDKYALSAKRYAQSPKGRRAHRDADNRYAATTAGILSRERRYQREARGASSGP